MIVFDRVPLPSQCGPSHRKWHRGKYECISRELNVVDWDAEFNGCDITQMYSRFLDILLPLIDDFVPMGDTTSVPARLPWKTNPPGNLRAKRKHAWETYKKARLCHGRKSVAAESALQNFFSLNRSLKRFSLDSQANYEQQLLEDCADNPKAFHAYLRRKKVGCPGVSPLRLTNDTISDDPAAMAQSLCGCFRECVRA